MDLGPPLATISIFMGTTGLPSNIHAYQCTSQQLTKIAVLGKAAQVRLDQSILEVVYAIEIKQFF
jgi:hypothetical protein